MIISASLPHGVRYHYRIHKHKLEQLCEKKYAELKKYIMTSFTNCPNKYFLEGPRSSILKFSVLKEKPPRIQHEVTLLARMGLDSNYYQDAHSNVQMFMLSYDQKTIAIETPIWLLPEEIEEYKTIFKEEKPLTGHIDIIRIENNKIWIWDYKPNAHREKYATTQTYFYALMLSKRSGIPLTEFMCGYFDDKNTYTFDPSKIILNEIIKNHELILQTTTHDAHIKT
ncbi:PD-(D/E)XK nuclease family protein [Candidatus Woesearchaeota archaeon]|nr:PD-(D/E)XK nuclease family protein [Candidatus Woesearchaeota archaeon]